ncbi:MAG: hypothetical protein KKF30_15670 [Proteobacteria bacterium]|nr:hypothetical protein [Pseudomonadota bacterium]MBU4472138.1 hypothetical protein [Pseudomonadota bacterium]MCG2752863.1 hypothetical protein [Desulfobacteraceae bacterium]
MTSSNPNPNGMDSQNLDNPEEKPNTKIEIDFNGHYLVLKAVERMAKIEMRPIEMQMLAMVSKQVDDIKRSFLTGNGEESYSKAAQMVLADLSIDEIMKLKRENPFKNEREAIISSLCKRGVKNSVISEVTGFSNQAISDRKLALLG